jgi:hypothetical protein
VVFSVPPVKRLQTDYGCILSHSSQDIIDIIGRYINYTLDEAFLNEGEHK